MDQYVPADATNLPEKLVMTLELVADDDGDPALVNDVGRDTATTLQSDGYTVQPVYIGQKGGVIVEITTTVIQLATMVWNNHATAAEVIADVSGLVTVFGTIVP